MWAKSIGGVLDDKGAVIKIDHLGNVYLAGYFANSADFDPGPSVSNLTSSFGSNLIFFASYDTDGNYIFAKELCNAAGASVTDLFVDPPNNFLLTGWFNTTLDFDPDAGTQNLSSNGTNDIFFAKYGTPEVAPPILTPIVGLNDNGDAGLNVMAYPNPATNSNNLKFSQNIANSSIDLINSLGETILTAEEIFIERNSELQFSFGQKVPPGFYIVKITSAKGTWIKKIIVE